MNDKFLPAFLSKKCKREWLLVVCCFLPIMLEKLQGYLNFELLCKLKFFQNLKIHFHMFDSRLCVVDRERVDLEIV